MPHGRRRRGGAPPWASGYGGADAVRERLHVVGGCRDRPAALPGVVPPGAARRGLRAASARGGAGSPPRLQLAPEPGGSRAALDVGGAPEARRRVGRGHRPVRGRGHRGVTTSAPAPRRPPHHAHEPPRRHETGPRRSRVRRGCIGRLLPAVAVGRRTRRLLPRRRRPVRDGPTGSVPALPPRDRTRPIAHRGLAIAAGYRYAGRGIAGHGLGEAALGDLGQVGARARREGVAHPGAPPRGRISPAGRRGAGIGGTTHSAACHATGRPPSSAAASPPAGRWRAASRGSGSFRPPSRQGAGAAGARFEPVPGAAALSG